MSRTRTLLTVLIPAAIAGGMFASPPTRADDDDVDVEAIKAEAKEQIKAARKEAKEQLKAAREQIENAPMPDKLRDKLLDKLDSIADQIDDRLKGAMSGDLDQLDDQMDAMGEAIEAEMEQMGEEWAQWGEDFQQGFKDSWGNGNGPVIVVPTPPTPPAPPDFDPDDLPTPPTAPTAPTPPSTWSGGTSASASAGVPSGIAIDLGDLDLSIDVGDLDLAADQVAALGDIFDAQQQLIEPAQEALDDLAEELRTTLADPNATESEVGKLVDALSAQEAVIRKAQIVAWVKSRNLLDADQRDKVEHAKVKRAKRAKHH